MGKNPYQSPGIYESRTTSAVVVLNDDLHTFAYVIETFRKVFGYTPERCYELAMAIHTQGRAIVWAGAIEIAELARDEIRSAGPDLYAAEMIDFPLTAEIEPIDPADAEAAMSTIKSVNAQNTTTDTFCRVLCWGGSALILASWVDAVTPTVGWIGFAVAGAGWLLSRTIRPRPVGQTPDQHDQPPYDRT